MDPTREKARLIARGGAKVEISFEKDGLLDVWFPGFVIEDLGEDLYLVEYKCLGFNDEAELRRVTVDYHHMRPSAPLYRDINIGLLEKVDAFYDFGWWTGVITKKLADSRYVVYFKHSNKVKEFSHVELRPHVEWKDGKLLTPHQVPVGNNTISNVVNNVENGVKHGESSFVKCSAEVRPTVSFNLTDPIENTTPATDSLNLTEPIEDTTPATVSLNLTEPIEDTTPATVSLNLTEPIEDTTPATVSLNLTEPIEDTTPATVSLNLTDPIEDTTPATVKETSTVTTSMKGAKATCVGSNDKHVKPSKKLKAGVTSDDPSLSKAGQSKEVSSPPVAQSECVKKAKVGGKTIEPTKSVSHGKRTRSALREKGVESNSSMTTSAQKKGKTSADNRGQKTSTKGDTGDSTKGSASDIEVEHANKDWPIRPVVIGLPCKAMALAQIKKSNQLTSESHSEIAEAKTPKSAVPLSPKTTGNQEVEESAADTVQKRKRGRPFKVKRQVKSRKTPLAEINENGDAVPAAVAVSKQKDTPSTALVNGDNMPNRGSGIELTLPEETYKTVKGKRGKRRSISSIESPTQESSKQKANGGLEIDSTTKNSEPPVVTMFNDQSLSRWVEGIQSSAIVVSTGKKQLENSKSSSAVANGNGETLSFEKRNSLWKMIESMEAFRKYPQKPHFRPLDELKQNIRERHAINQMIAFSGVVEDISRLRHSNQKSDIEDHLNTLSELETHGFDVKKIRDRLMEMLPMKSSCEELEKERDKNRYKVMVKNDGGQTINKEIQEIEKQISELHEKHGVALSKKMKNDSDIAELDAEYDKIQDALRDVTRHFDELAAAPL